MREGESYRVCVWERDRERESKRKREMERERERERERESGFIESGPPSFIWSRCGAALKATEERPMSEKPKKEKIQGEPKDAKTKKGSANIIVQLRVKLIKMWLIKLRLFKIQLIKIRVMKIQLIKIRLIKILPIKMQLIRFQMIKIWLIKKNIRNYFYHLSKLFLFVAIYFWSLVLLLNLF